jgi:hypothetical protein
MWAPWLATRWALLLGRVASELQAAVSGVPHACCRLTATPTAAARPRPVPAAIADELAAVSVVVQAWPLRWAAAQARLQLQEQQGAQGGAAQQQVGSQPGAGGFWIINPGERPASSFRLAPRQRSQRCCSQSQASSGCPPLALPAPPRPQTRPNATSRRSGAQPAAGRRLGRRGVARAAALAAGLPDGGGAAAPAAGAQAAHLGARLLRRLLGCAGPRCTCRRLRLLRRLELPVATGCWRRVLRTTALPDLLPDLLAALPPLQASPW